MSGFPWFTELVRLESQMASKERASPDSPAASALSAMRPVRPLWASMARLRGLARNSPVQFFQPHPGGGPDFLHGLDELAGGDTLGVGNLH
jgi:hypothetical protein